MKDQAELFTTTLPLSNADRLAIWRNKMNARRALARILISHDRFREQIQDLGFAPPPQQPQAPGL